MELPKLTRELPKLSGRDRRKLLSGGVRRKLVSHASPDRRPAFGAMRGEVDGVGGAEAASSRACPGGPGSPGDCGNCCRWPVERRGLAARNGCDRVHAA